jgi:DNA-binding SARP family transcriptional activator
MLEVRLFGAAQAQYCGHRLAGFPNQQSHLLLCYLLLNQRRPHQREQLAAVFWHEFPTAVSRKHLRNALWRLRAALEAAGAPAEMYLLLREDAVAFAPSAPVWLDIQAFEAVVAGLQDLRHDLTPEEAAALAEAVDLYTGDLLEGVYEDWCLCERERLRLLYLNALYRLMVYHGAQGCYDCALAYGERIILREDTHEKAHRQMMQLYWLSGQRSRALAQYKRCAQVLRETLGVAPLASTRRLYRQMLRDSVDPTGWFAFAPSTPAAEAMGGLAPRADERAHQRLRRLEALLEEAQVELHTIARLLGATSVSHTDASLTGAGLSPALRNARLRDA